MYDVIVIGAGPAGLASSLYLRRAGKKILVLEANSYGGQIINTLDIENYPGEMHISGFDLIEKINKQVEEQGVKITFEKVLKIKNGQNKKIVITSKNTYEALSIIIATGSQNRKLGLNNEKELIGRGISYCATCDGNFYQNKDVLVVGGGNTAIEDALYLANITKKVYLVHRRDTFRADFKSIQLLKEKKNVEFIYQSNVTKINGKDKLESVEITNNQGEKKVIKIDGLFIAIGQVPQNECFKNTIKVDDNGYVLAKENCHTNKKGIFVAGDVRRKSLRQLVTAISDGAVAATEAIKYLDNMQLTKK